MFDFSWSEHTFGNVLYCTIAYALFIIYYYGRYVSRALFQDHKTNYILMFSAIVLIITACIDTDWFHYQTMVHEYDLLYGALNYGEPAYWGIVKLADKNYLLFRLIVWGSAFLMTTITFRRYKININTAVFFLVAVFLIKFNYARATLGMAIYFLGLSFLTIPLKKHRILSLLLAVIFLWGAYEFHHSMILLIFLTPIVIIPLDKPFIAIIVLIGLPFFASALNENIFLIDRLENEYISNKMETYLEREGSVANIYGIIQSVISYGVFIVPLFLDTIVIALNRDKIEASIQKLYRIIIATIILTVSFLLMNLDSSVFVYRILFMTFIPLNMLTVHLYEQQILSKRGYTIIVCWGIMAIYFVLFHLLYKYI